MDNGSSGADQVRWDADRKARRGFSESVLCVGKSDKQIETIAWRLAEQAVAAPVIFTRLDPAMADRLKAMFPRQAIAYDAQGRTLVWGEIPDPDPRLSVGILTAGTSDAPVAREAEVTLAVEGIATVVRYDVGVAGIHRLMAVWPDFEGCDVLIVAAGMDGALPSVVGGMASQPIVAVPTSVGYGAHLDGLAPLLTMLNSCAEGIAVVNIDNGFGAARMALQILRIKSRGLAGGRSSRS